MRGFLSFIVGVAALIALNSAAGALLGPVKCRDGWASPSIGSPGACSWHGGVDRSRDRLSFIFMVIGGFAGFAFHSSKFAHRFDRSPPPQQSPPGPTILHGSAASSSPPALTSRPIPNPLPPKPIIPARPGAKACPQCGSGMKLRTARQGPRRGRRFWGCTRYPSCRGTINIERRLRR